MFWPSNYDYNLTVENPSICFSDKMLKDGTILNDKFGLPRVYSGGFACVYQSTEKSGKKWAVRCFLRHYDDSQERYAAISDYLQKVNLPCAADFTYQPRGIWLKGQWYPIVKMEWVEGQCLDEYISEIAQREPAKLINLAKTWGYLMNTLRSARIAHGDLHHANIIVNDADDLKLVDYDDNA